MRIIRKNNLQVILNPICEIAIENNSQVRVMILKTQTKMLTLLMALDCQRNEKRFLDSVSDAIMIAHANPNVPPDSETASNDRTRFSRQLLKDK